jgi:hypothetical protein
MGRDKERGFSICGEFDLSYFSEFTDENRKRKTPLGRTNAFGHKIDAGD